LLHSLLIEAESFDDYGGWKLDSQFVDIMGSPYLIAHGLGNPVQPATTTVQLPEGGTWYVWVRTKNWIPGEWEAPGRFKLGINGATLDKTFGVDLDDWGWECGGPVSVDATELRLSLIDVTGFDGRCDAIFLTQDDALVPDNGFEPMSTWRKRHGSMRDSTVNKVYDLVVVGGGIAGVAAAISGARAGLQVALIQAPPFLGGNCSPEVRVKPCGDFPPGQYPHLGDIVKEMRFDLENSQPESDEFEKAEEVRRALVAREPNIDLFLNHFMYSVDVAQNHISAVWVLRTDSRSYRQISGKLFCDATGHGLLGVKAGADYKMEPRQRMGMTNYWYWQFEADNVPFPEIPWALPLTEKSFPYPTDAGMEVTPGQRAKARKWRPVKKMGRANWNWESGFDKHPLQDLESIRDHNMRACYSAMNALKNGGAYAALDPLGKSHATAKLLFLAYVGGPRETLQLLGDVIVSEDDVYRDHPFPDGCVPATWGIDLHLPMPVYAKETPDNPFISRAHFDGRVDDSKGEWQASPIPCVQGEMRGNYDRGKGYLFPYRSFYSRNIDNLFMAGRDISCSHEALGTVRVMNTLGMIGVVVGRAAAIACKYDTTPRGVYQDHWEALQALLSQPGMYRSPVRQTESSREI
jgi:hypothetical protein